MRHRGFILIEIMTVISIISILAVMSLPSYTHYLRRAKVSEAFALTPNIMRLITEYYAYYGRLPANNQDLALPLNLQGRYVGSINVENGAIHVTFSDSTLTGTLTLRPAIAKTDTPAYALIWICGYAHVPAGAYPMRENRTTIPYLYLPSACV